MSYAGKAARGRRNAHQDGDSVTGTARRRAAAPAAPAPSLDREIAFSPGTRAQRLIAGSEDSEVDWQRVALFATGTLLGAVVGAGAALLLAPQAGEETRRDLARQGRRLRARTADAWDDLRDELQWAAHRGRRRLQRSFRDRRARRAERALDDAEI
jgi:gas vesicle protein